MGLTYDQGAYIQQAVADANSFGGLSGDPITPHNDQYDAYRHAILSAELMQAGPDAISKYILDNHEANPLNPPAEKNMDKWNNDVGAKEYYKWKEAVDSGQTTDSLRKWIYDRVVEGKTINNPFDIHDGRIFKDPATPSIPTTTNTPYNDSRNWQPRRDPLTLDLDGDGLETVGIAATNPIQFDHDGDGIKNGTGWVSSDDAFLVLDKNSNGTIDNGRELFGDNTIKSNGQLATDGLDSTAKCDNRMIKEYLIRG